MRFTRKRQDVVRITLKAPRMWKAPATRDGGPTRLRQWVHVLHSRFAPERDRFYWTAL